MRQLPLIALVFMLTAGMISSCKDKVLEEVVTNIAASSYGQTGCRGRNSGIKTGPNSLYLPYPNGVSHLVSQTWFGSFSHDFEGREHALDFPMSTNDDIYPVLGGKVIAIKEDSNITCTSNCSDANYVLIDHGGGFYGRYVHFCQNCVEVSVGEDVSSDTRIGGAGNTGWSTGTHLHFELVDWEENCTVTYGFNENSNAPTPLVQGNTYTSANAGVFSYSASTIGGDTFLNVGIELTNTVTWYLTNASTITLQGTLTTAAQSEGSNGVAVFLVNQDGTVVANSLEYISTTSTFNYNYDLPSVSAGTYYLGISKSTNNSYMYNNPPYIVIHN